MSTSQCLRVFFVLRTTSRALNWAVCSKICIKWWKVSLSQHSVTFFVLFAALWELKLVISSQNFLKFPTNLPKTSRIEPWFTFCWHILDFLLPLGLLLTICRENWPKNLPKTAHEDKNGPKIDPEALPIDLSAIFSEFFPISFGRPL